MLDVLDKYKDTFFVVELNFDPSKFEIRDPDPLIANDLMDGREPFLLFVCRGLFYFGLYLQ